MTRCELLAFAASSTLLRARETPASPVSIARDASYDEDLSAIPATMFDQLGGGSGRVAYKTVPIKLNLTRNSGLKLDSNGAATNPLAKEI